MNLNVRMLDTNRIDLGRSSSGGAEIKMAHVRPEVGGEELEVGVC